MKNFLTLSASLSTLKVVPITPQAFLFNPGVSILLIRFPPNVSTITRRAHDPICIFHEFVLRPNHERLRLKQIELKRIRSEELLARIRGDIRDDVLQNACSPANHALGDASSNDYDSNDGWLDTYNLD